MKHSRRNVISSFLALFGAGIVAAAPGVAFTATGHSHSHRLQTSRTTVSNVRVMALRLTPSRVIVRYRGTPHRPLAVVVDWHRIATLRHRPLRAVIARRHLGRRTNHRIAIRDAHTGKLLSLRMLAFARSAKTQGGHAPTISITSAPAATTSDTRISIGWATTAAQAVTCSLDGSNASPCASPATFSVASGAHVFRISATNKWGSANTDVAFTVTTPTAPAPTPPPTTTTTTTSAPTTTTTSAPTTTTTTTTPTTTTTATPQPPPPPPSSGGSWAWDASAATVDTNSASLVQSWLGYAVVNPNLAFGSWAVATADSTSSSPCYRVPLTSGGNIDSSVCIPIGTKPDPSDDGHLTIRDTVHGRETDLWQAKYDSSSGRISSASAGVSFALGAVNEQTTGWGGNAANLPLRRGLVTPADIRSGVIDHPLVFGEPSIGTGGPRFPALHNAATGPSGHLVEGTWMRLDPSVKCGSLGLPAWQAMVCVALQRYGMFLRDNSGTLAIYGENTINDGGSAAWSAVGLSGSSAGFSSSFPWAKMQVLLPPS